MNKLTIRSLVAAAVASLALVAVGPANADRKPPTDENGKKGCLLNTDPTKDYDTYYTHGSTITINVASTGSHTTYRCNDGKWKRSGRRLSAVPPSTSEPGPSASPTAAERSSSRSPRSTAVPTPPASTSVSRR